MPFRRLLLFALAIGAVWPTVCAQDAGRPWVRPVEIESQTVTAPVLDMLQGPDGLIYVASARGVGMYDGVRWQRARIGNAAEAGVLALGPDGRVWAGGEREVGWLAPDSTRRLRFVSMRDRLSPDGRPQGRVRALHVTDQAVVFATDQTLVRWKASGETQTWTPRPPFTVSVVDGMVYVHESGRGLLRLGGGGLQRVPGGEVFRGLEGVAVNAGPEGEVWVMGRRSLWISEGAGFVRRSTGADAILAETPALAHAARWALGRFVVPTVGGGLLWVRPDGSLSRQVGTGSGLPDDSPRSVLEDREGGLWVGGEEGLSRIAAPRAIRQFAEPEGLRGVVRHVARADGALVAATTMGLYRLRQGRFEPVDGVQGPCLTVLPMGSGTLAGCGDGLYRVGERGAILLADLEAEVLVRSRLDSSLVWAGTPGGIVPLRRSSDTWRADGVLPGTEGRVLSIVEGADGAVWAGYRGRQVVVARPARADGWDVEVYGEDDGIVRTNWSFVWEIGGEPAVSTKRGLFRIRPDETPSLVPDPDLGALFEATSRESLQLFRLAEGPDGSVWRYGGGNLGQARPGDAGWAWHADPTQILTTLPGQLYALTVEDDGTVWAGGADGLFRIDASAMSGEPRPYQALVRRVRTVATDSLVWDGAGPLTLDAGLDALRFEFAAARFAAPDATRYRYRLAPLEHEWSVWTDAAVKEYTNVPPGRYRFEVQAVDVMGQESRVGAVAFSLAAPWYGTGWARALWGGLGLGALAGLVGGGVEWRTRRLREREAELEAEVADRTEALALENRRTEAALLDAEQARADAEAAAATVEAQRRELARLDDAKTRFFTNVSHEFRTPLTLLIGPLDDLDQDALDSEAREALALATRNGRRLLKLTNQLLDVARLDADAFALAPQPLDLGPYVEALVLAFVPLAERRGLALSFRKPSAPVVVSADPEAFEQVVVNLLSNALKYTPSGGRVQVSVDDHDGEAQLTVEDDGPGIPADLLPHLFDRFFRVDETHAETGSGIGLGIAYDVTRLHRGTLAVDSTVGEGSRFTVALPLSDADAEPAPTSALDLDLGPDAEPATPDTDDEDRTTVLVVDDNADIRRYVRRQFEPTYRVVEAVDGQHALDRVRERLPDCVVADVMMPRLDGFGLLAALRDDPATDFVPVVLLTARATEDDKVEGLAGGADDYLVKPFSARELRARVDNLIASRRRLLGRVHDAAPAADDDSLVARARRAVTVALGDEDFSPDALAAALAQSRSTLSRRLREAADTTPAALIREVRLEHAARLLASGEGSVTEVAYGVGFKSVSHFSRVFGERYGEAPSVYAEQAA